MDWKYLLLFPLLFFGCQTEKEAQDPLEVRIDYQNAKVKPFEDLLRERPIQEEYVLLRSKSSETDFSKPKKILVQNEKIFILDSARPTKLVVFSREGEGLAQVGTRGEGPQEYLSIADFDVADDGKIYFIDGQSDKLFCFNEDFSFAYTKDLPFEADILKAVSGGFLFGLSSWNTGECEGAKIIRTDWELNVQETFLKYDEYTDPAFWISSYTFIRTKDGIIYNQTIDNHIYQFDPDGNYKGSVNMDFGSRNVPNEAKKEIESKLRDYEEYDLLKNYVAVTDNYIIGALWKSRKTVPFVYDRRTNTSYLCAEQEEYASPALIGYSDTLSIAYYEPTMDISMLPDSVQNFLEKEDFVLCIRNIY